MTDIAKSQIVTGYDRHIELEGACNVRDMGGYPSVFGGHVRWGRLLRADGLHMLSVDDKRRLKAMGMRTVIDLRFAGELATAPNVYANAKDVSYCHIPLHEDKMHAGIAALPRDLEAYYRMLIDHAGPQLRCVIERLSQPGALPAVVHCTLGKDRTGLVIALVLDMLGVPHELIVHDYALTAHYGESLLNSMREKVTTHGQHTEWHLRMLACEPAAMTTALSYLEATHGNASNYLIQHGLDPYTPACLRKELLGR